MVILLVDGDAQTRTERSALLRAHGHEVMEAATAVEAVHWAQEAEAIHLLVTEVILENDTFGFDLSDAIKERLPEMRTLYTTRYDLTGYEDNLAGAVPVAVTATDEVFLSMVATAAAPAVTPPQTQMPVLAPGTTLGHYQVMGCLYTEAEAETYHAIQYTVQRHVALVLLKPHLINDERAVKEFKDRERIKASISHPRIAPLYEAGEVGGLMYYTRELPMGRSLEQVITAGEHFNERVVVDVLYRVSEAMSYAVERGYGYRRLTARDIYVDDESQASIVNIFRPAPATPRDQPADVVALLELMGPLVNPGKARGLLQDLSEKPHDWASLHSRLDDIRHDMSERSLIRLAEDEDISVGQPASKQWLIWVVAIVVLGVVAWLGGLTGKELQTSKNIVPLEMVEVKEGKFVYQNQKREREPLATFWISKYKVTIAQYAEFLDALKKSPPKAFDDPKQPAIKTSHVPPDWDAYYAAASANGLLNNEQISLNSPVCRVDYWDAVAFAKWKHQRLPTEQEWEKAARGYEGNLFPWGNEPKPAFNYVVSSKGGPGDGHNRWAPVDQIKDDISSFGVVGLAGYMQEWTSSQALHPALIVNVPVVRGGHFDIGRSDQVLTSRSFPKNAGEATLARGFRTASDKAPNPAPVVETPKTAGNK